MPITSVTNTHISPIINGAMIMGDLQRKTKTQKVCTAIVFEPPMRMKYHYPGRVLTSELGAKVNQV